MISGPDSIIQICADISVYYHIRGRYILPVNNFLVATGILILNFDTAGGHDGGYATFLRSLQTDRLLDKFVLLRSTTPFARAIAELGLDELDARDIFVAFNNIPSPEQRTDPNVLSPPPPSYGTFHTPAPNNAPTLVPGQDAPSQAQDYSPPVPAMLSEDKVRASELS